MARRLSLGALPPEERRAALPRHLLALSGGGYRGLFTARSLELLEAQAGGPLRERFDLIGGTSIGGIVGIAIACGIPATTIIAQFADHGARIFRTDLRRLGGLTGARYPAKPLRVAIEAILGAWAKKPFAEIPAAVLVVAIDEQQGRPKVFRSNRLAPGAGDQTAILDVAMATSAAPTFFPPHSIEGRIYVDGGLVANAPDLVVATEAMRCFGAALSDLRVLCVGTAGSPRVGRAKGDPGVVGWLTRHRLVEMTIDAQAVLAADQLQQLGIGRILRIDATPRDPITLDDASPAAATQLRALADGAIAAARQSRAADFNLFLGHRAP